MKAQELIEALLQEAQYRMPADFETAMFDFYGLNALWFDRGGGKSKLGYPETEFTSGRREDLIYDFLDSSANQFGTKLLRVIDMMFPEYKLLKNASTIAIPKLPKGEKQKSLGHRSYDYSYVIDKAVELRRALQRGTLEGNEGIVLSIDRLIDAGHMEYGSFFAGGARHPDEGNPRLTISDHALDVRSELKTPEDYIPFVSNSVKLLIRSDVSPAKVADHNLDVTREGKKPKDRRDVNKKFTDWATANGFSFEKPREKEDNLFKLVIDGTDHYIDPSNPNDVGRIKLEVAEMGLEPLDLPATDYTDIAPLEPKDQEWKSWADQHGVETKVEFSYSTTNGKPIRIPRLYLKSKTSGEWRHPGIGYGTEEENREDDAEFFGVLTPEVKARIFREFKKTGGYYRSAGSGRKPEAEITDTDSDWLKNLKNDMAKKKAWIQSLSSESREKLAKAWEAGWDEKDAEISAEKQHAFDKMAQAIAAAPEDEALKERFKELKLSPIELSQLPPEEQFKMINGAIDQIGYGPEEGKISWEIFNTLSAKLSQILREMDNPVPRTG